MSFWRGFLDQWNREEELAQRKAEREEDIAFKREQLDTERKLALLKTGASRTAKSASDVTAMAAAARWVDSKIPEGTPGKEEYMTSIQREPRLALEIQKRYEDHQKSAGRWGQAAIRGEDIMSTFEVVRANPELLAGTETWAELQKEIFGTDLADSEKYIELTERAMRVGQPDVATVVTGDISIMSPQIQDQQKKIVDSVIAQKDTQQKRHISKHFDSYVKLGKARGYEDLKGVTPSDMQSEWDKLVKQYTEEGVVDAGVVVFNTLDLTTYLDELAETTSGLHNYQKNPYFSVVFNQAADDDRDFVDYYFQKKLEQLRARALE